MSWTAVGAALLAVLALAVTANNRPEFGEEIKEIIRQIHNTCVDRTGAAEEDIANCENGIFKEDAKLKCYMSCLLEEATVIDTDEVVDYEFLVSMISEEWKERFSKMIYACRYLDTPDKDICQRAFDVHKCAHGQDPELYYAF
nr:Odorant-binding protein 23 [Metisa plana]